MLREEFLLDKCPRDDNNCPLLPDNCPSKRDSITYQSHEPTSMKFFLHKSSSLPAQEQLYDEIKFAIGVGRLRPGDALPSVRELELELGIGKNTIWRVYQHLETAGLLTLRQGQGARVNSDIPWIDYKEKLRQCQELSKATFERVLRSGINPASFLRYFQQYVAKETAEFPSVIFAECNKTETEFFANQISDLWGIEVGGVAIDELSKLVGHKTPGHNPAVLTNLYHMEEVRGLLKGTSVEVIGLQFHWDKRMLRTIHNLKPPADVLFVFQDEDEHRYGKLIIEEFSSLVGDRRISLTLKGISRVGSLQRLCKGKLYNHIFFSNRLWHRIPPEIKKLSFVGRPTLQLDPRSLESARTKVGVIW
jgi:DNA-binding transcriptional regulator YhcF (GntR family)